MTGTAADQPLLAVDEVNLSFGGIQVLQDVSLEVNDQDLAALIGPNGAGKTSALNCISGFYHPRSGSIRYRGQEILGKRPDEIAHLGVSRVFQNVELFPHLTVLENILIGRHRHLGYTAWEAFAFGFRLKRREMAHRRVAEDLIEFLEIEEIRHTLVAALPYGLEKKVEMARALASEPDLLLLDEPFGGLSVEEKQDMARYILEVRRAGRTVLLIDHDVQVVADIADHISVLDYGRLIAQGEPSYVLRHSKVIEAYLGTQKVDVGPADDPVESEVPNAR